MGLAEDLKALQELRDKGELSESAYAAARDAAIGKQTPPQPTQQPSQPTQPIPVAKKPLIGTLAKVIIAFGVLFVGFNIIYRITQSQDQSNNFFHTPETITDEVENVPAASWKALNYSFPMGGKLEITARVVNGNPLDIFLTPADQMDAMKKREWGSVKTYNDFNATKTKEYHRTAQLGPGSYCLVLRDTSLGILSAHATDVSVKTILTP
jgi:hypothetical protein